jgi:3-deoxy-D-manno-octulosonic-acid transferase
MTVDPPLRLYLRMRGDKGEALRQRFGSHDPRAAAGIAGFPRIWLHAASVGEVGAAVPIVEDLKRRLPGCALVLSTSTRHGRISAQEKLGASVTCIYAPLDFPVSVTRCFAFVRPQLLVCLETEIWPNLLFTARRLGISTALINGRLSVRSVGRYRKVRPLIAEALGTVEAFSMIRREDAERIAELGASPERISVNGNSKYDFLVRQADPSLRTKMGKIYNLKGFEPVFVAGSTRSLEEEMVLAAYREICREIPGTVLILAPRHVKRAGKIAGIVRRFGFSCQMRTELARPGALRTAQVVVVDTIGELSATYSVASIAFCGGSLVPLGGQNVLEAAVWGVPVLFGPSMDDFLDAKELLEREGGGVPVANGRELAEKGRMLLADREKAAGVGSRGREAVMSQRGAAEKHAAVIYRLLGNRGFIRS